MSLTREPFRNRLYESLRTGFLDKYNDKNTQLNPPLVSACTVEHVLLASILSLIATV